MKPAIVNLRQAPALVGAVREMGTAAWPRFLLHGDVRHWHTLFGELAEWQSVLIDGNRAPLAVGHAAPIAWDGTKRDLPPTIASILDRALTARAQGTPPTALAALAAVVRPASRGQGLSSVIVSAMGLLAGRAGFDALIAPVRPTRKADHPWVAMEEYIRWKNPEGLPFDPWMRVHSRLGATILRVAPKAMTVEGRVAEWESWTGLRFPESGSYEVPGALCPVRIDRKRDRGLYIEPNVWMLHKVPMMTHPMWFWRDAERP